jgi:hypothetical protein
MVIAYTTAISIVEKQFAPLCAGCPLYPQKRTLEDITSMSALCQKRTHAPQQKGLFDHLVGAAKERCSIFAPERVKIALNA